MRILKPVLVLAAATFLLPSPPEHTPSPPQRTAANTDPSFLELFGAAFSTLGDFGTFCTRQEGVCATAQHFLVRLQAKATYSAQLIYDWARSDAAGDPALAPLKNEASIGSLITGSTAAAASGSKDTLSADDLVPPWKAAKGGNG